MLLCYFLHRGLPLSLALIQRVALRARFRALPRDNRVFILLLISIVRRTTRFDHAGIIGRQIANTALFKIQLICVLASQLQVISYLRLCYLLFSYLLHLVDLLFKTLLDDHRLTLPVGRQALITLLALQRHLRGRVEMLRAIGSVVETIIPLLAEIRIGGGVNVLMTSIRLNDT